MTMSAERMKYLESLEDDYMYLNLEDIITVAEMLGENEDYDGLISSLEELDEFYEIGGR